MKNLWKARFILPVLLVGLGAAWLIHERVRLTRDRWMLDIMIKDTTLPLDVMIMRNTAPTTYAFVKDRRVIRDEAFFSTDAPASDVAAAIRRFADKHSSDDSSINWAVYDNRANNGKNRPNPPDDFRTLIWIAVDTNEDWF